MFILGVIVVVAVAAILWVVMANAADRGLPDEGIRRGARFVLPVSHLICDECWPSYGPHASRTEPFRMRTPELEDVRVLVDGGEVPRWFGENVEPCCFCGQETGSGIFVRESPESERLICNSVGKVHRE